MQPEAKWLGVDVSKAELVAAYRKGKTFEIIRVPNTVSGFEKLLRSRQHWNAVCLEPTGPYWKLFASWLRTQGIPVVLANPRDVRDFAKAMGQRSKSDPIDARILVHFAEVRQLEPLKPTSLALQQIQSLSRTCQILQDEVNTTRDRIEKAQADPATPRAVFEAFDTLCNVLEGQIEDLEREIQTRIEGDTELDRVWHLLRSIVGVGPKTARTLIAEYGAGLLWASPAQLVAYAGLDVVLTESGTSLHTLPRISKKGNWRIRRALYLAALTAIRHNPIIQDLYLRLVDRDIAKKAALVAAMRKLLHLCHGVIKNDTPFDPEFQAGRAIQPAATA